MVLETAKKKIIPCFETHTQQKNIMDICFETDMYYSSVSFYLQILVKAGILERIRGRDKKFYYNMVEQAMCIEKDARVVCMTPGGRI